MIKLTGGVVSIQAQDPKSGSASVIDVRLPPSRECEGVKDLAEACARSIVAALSAIIPLDESAAIKEKLNQSQALVAELQAKLASKPAPEQSEAASKVKRAFRSK